MVIKRHQKIIIGSFSFIIIIFMIISSIFTYLIFVKQNYNYNSLNEKITDLKTETYSNINILTENLIQTQSSMEEHQEALQEEFSLLKASAGEDFSGIIEEAIKSVVTIRTNSGQGTGFIISDEGYLVTNAHVLADKEGKLASNIKAITYEQKIIAIDFIGYDGTLDVALLKIPGDYYSLELENSDDVQIGEKVIAIGNPLGLQFSVSEGIVSNIHQIGPSGIKSYIQTDAALNPGNSGGPLINKQGKVIGINNFKISESEGLGFALESNYLKEVINTIAQTNLNQILIE